MTADPRSGVERRRDTKHRLTHDIDVRVASASADGAPYLVPLTFDWDGEALLMATPERSSGATCCHASKGTFSSNTPASTRVRWPRRTASSASPLQDGDREGGAVQPMEAR